MYKRQLEGDSRITLTTPLESRGYVDMTLEALERFGIRAECPDGRTLRVPGGQTYRPCRAAVESDYSQAAFYYACLLYTSAAGPRPSSWAGP